MYRTLAFLVAVLVASSLSAGTITALDPPSIVVNSGEQFLTIHGTDLGGVVRFSGPAGELELEISSGGGDRVIVWVPQEVVATIGTHQVVVVGGASGDSGPAAFEVTEAGPHPLVLQVPDPIAVPAATREGAHVTYEVTTYGGQDPNPVVTCDPPSGSLFPLGRTLVHCVATNSFGERAEDDLSITVYDATVPVLTLPERIVVPADGPDGTVVTWAASATDDIDGELPVVCNPESGSRFPVGVTKVECSATDLSYNPAYGEFEVEVTPGDQETLVIDVPDPITAEAEGPDGTAVTFTVTASGTSDPEPDVTCDPESGSVFALGTTTVQCTAADDFGNTASDSFTVTIVDTVSPVISAITATPDTLVPPNNKLVQVTVDVDASDVADAMPRCMIFRVTSNEDISGDTNITGDLTVELRAERETNERRYLIHVTCTDDSGNFAEGEVTVRVPRGNDAQTTPAPEPAPRKSFRQWW